MPRDAKPYYIKPESGVTWYARSSAINNVMPVPEPCLHTDREYIIEGIVAS